MKKYIVYDVDKGAQEKAEAELAEAVNGKKRFIKRYPFQLYALNGCNYSISIRKKIKGLDSLENFLHDFIRYAQSNLIAIEKYIFSKYAIHGSMSEIIMDVEKAELTFSLLYNHPNMFNALGKDHLKLEYFLAQMDMEIENIGGTLVDATDFYQSPNGRKEQLYNDGNGKHQELWDILSEEPLLTPGKTRPGELFRAAQWLYDSWHSDYERIEEKFSIKRNATIINAWNFLRRFPDYDASELADNLYSASSMEDYEHCLEEMMDAVLEYVNHAEPIPNDMDIGDHQYDDVSNFTFIDDDDLENDEEY